MAENQSDPIQRPRSFGQRIKHYLNRHREPKSSFPLVKLTSGKPGSFALITNNAIRRRLRTVPDQPVTALPRRTLALGGVNLHFNSTEHTKQHGWWTPFGRMTWSKASPRKEWRLQRAARYQLEKGLAQIVQEPGRQETAPRATAQQQPGETRQVQVREPTVHPQDPRDPVVALETHAPEGRAEGQRAPQQLERQPETSHLTLRSEAADAPERKERPLESGRSFSLVP